MVRGLVYLILLAGTVAPLAAQAPAPAKKLAVTPAALPSPALKYELLPELRDMVPGNAALFYQRAHSPEWWSGVIRQKLIEGEKIDRWLEVPLEKLPRAETRFLEGWGALREVDRAARHEFCDWELTERLKSEGIGLLLPDVQGFRSYALLLAVRCRLEMADGQLDKSVYTLQTGFKLARDIANAPTLIQGLVGLAVAQVMVDRVEEVMQRPGAPNLYWALASLPEPFIDLRKPFQGDRLFLETTYPELKTVEDAVWNAQQQQNFLSRLDQVRTGMVRDWHIRPSKDLEMKLVAMAMVIKTYPEAKQFLLARGRPANEVEAMSALQVALIYWVHNYNRVQDDYYKWLALPYWQARPSLEKTDQEIRTSAGRLVFFPFSDLLPAGGKFYEIRVRLDRRLAALRCIEAVRLYAAGHEGKLPASLRDITEVPIPVDPATGRGFEYTVTGERFVLRGADSVNGTPVLPGNPLHYEVTIKH